MTGRVIGFAAVAIDDNGSPLLDEENRPIRQEFTGENAYLRFKAEVVDLKVPGIAYYTIIQDELGSIWETLGYFESTEVGQRVFQRNCHCKDPFWVFNEASLTSACGSCRKQQTDLSLQRRGVDLFSEDGPHWLGH